MQFTALTIFLAALAGGLAAWLFTSVFRKDRQRIEPVSERFENGEIFPITGAIEGLPAWLGEILPPEKLKIWSDFASLVAAECGSAGLIYRRDGEILGILTWRTGNVRAPAIFRQPADPDGERPELRVPPKGAVVGKEITVDLLAAKEDREEILRRLAEFALEVAEKQGYPHLAVIRPQDNPNVPGRDFWTGLGFGGIISRPYTLISGDED